MSARPTDGSREAVIRVASTAYFDVMRIAVVAGRTFDRRDDASAPARVVISESLAARLFRRESPIGRSITLDARSQSAEVIGVVRDVKHRSLDEPELPTLYLSMWQFPSRGSQLVLRTTVSDRDAIAAVREQVSRLDGDLPVYGVGSMSNAVERSPGVPARRVLTAAFLGFALLAVVLGAIGLFGVVAHEVAARRPELALRIALGANPSRILTSTLGQGVSMIGVGAGYRRCVVVLGIARTGRCHEHCRRRRSGECNCRGRGADARRRLRGASCGSPRSADGSADRSA